MLYVWIGLGLGLVAVLAYFAWRWWQGRQLRMISFVALLREPAALEARVIARVANKVWKTDLGDGDSEGADGFVAGEPPITAIKHQDQMYLVNSFDRPYVDQVEECAENITELRVRELFREHTAWFSCDVMGISRATPEASVRELYRKLGRLFAELLDENCLLIFLPDTNEAFPINEETEAALRSQHPIDELRATMTLPIVEVDNDDPRMMAAVDKARAQFSEFQDAFERGAGANFSVKAPVSHSGNTEFIWIEVTTIEGDLIYGKLGNDPGNLGPLKFGSRVSVRIAELNDWCYTNSKGGLAGGFTIEVLEKAAREKRRK